MPTFCDSIPAAMMHAYERIEKADAASMYVKVKTFRSS